jgi:mono/diheme cytochrome c family protein
MRPQPSGFSLLGALLVSAGCMASIGCSHIPGRPGPGPEVVRPEEVLAFPVLYQQNCAACHGDHGKSGAAIPLANPVYLAVVGEDHLRDTIAKGVPGRLMPPFAKSSGGMLTDQQVTLLAQGILREWSRPSVLASQTPPAYQSTLTGSTGRGQQAFSAFCARCHGAAGEGHTSDAKDKASKLGSIVDPSYLALISDQNLRSITISGRPDEGMPDWRSDGTQPLTDQQITDIITWLASKRTADPGQPYATHP